MLRVQLVWVIDLTTWLVLVPMLLDDPDPVKRAHWSSVMFNFTSYNVMPRSLRGKPRPLEVLAVLCHATHPHICTLKGRLAGTTACVLLGCC